MPQSSFRIAAKAIREPSGDQLGRKSLPPLAVDTWRTSEPSGFIAKIASWAAGTGSPSRTNAILLPSGDHTGMNSGRGSTVSRTTSVPSESMT